MAALPAAAANAGFAQRAAAAFSTARLSVNPATLRSYDRIALKFQAFCQEGAGITWVDATATVVAAFLDELRGAHAAEGKGASGVALAKAAISFLFESCSLPDPSANSSLVKRVMKVTGQLKSQRPLLREPVTAPDLLALVERYIQGPLRRHEQPSLMDAMHVVAFVLCFTAFLRYDDLAHVLVHESCLQFVEGPEPGAPSALRVLIPRSKTDQGWQGAWVEVPALPGCPACPVKLVRWLLDFGGYVTSAPDLDCGPLVRQVTFSAGRHTLSQVTSTFDALIPPLSDDRLRNRLRGLLLSVGIDKDVGLHSLRIGGATAAAAKGVPAQVSRAHGRWASHSAHLRYVRGPQVMLPPSVAPTMATVSLF